ncbi:MAG TPA: T9SS type A sorting domain-containing protein, partial [Parafilimonas sp.]
NNITMGGYFQYEKYNSRYYLAALSLTTGYANTWNPSPDNVVYGIALNYNRIFAAGVFDNVGGLQHDGAAAFNLSSGALLTWNPQLSKNGAPTSGDLYAISADSNNVYLGGSFDMVKSTARNNVAAVTASNASLLSWDPSASNIVRYIAQNNSSILFGGDFSFCKGAARTNVAQIDSASGLITTWNPGCSGYVYAITQNGSNVYIGGNYSQLAGVTRNSLGAVNANTGSVANFDPVVLYNGSAGYVYSLGFDASNILYVGGLFNSVKSTTRNDLAALNTSAALQSWDPNANSSVNAIAINGSTIFVGGQFTTLNGGTARNYLAAVNNTNGTVTSFNPNMNSYVYSLWLNGNTLYAGGSFTTANGTGRNYLASFNATSGALNTWNPNANNSVYAVAASSDTVYVGGYFSQINGIARTRLAAVRAAAGTTLLNFDPAPNNLVRDNNIIDKVLLTAGSFNVIAGKSRGGFAVYKLPGNNNNPFTSGSDNTSIAQSATANKLQSTNDAFTVYPNPAHSSATLKFTKALSGSVVITITDMNGSKALQQTVHGDYQNYIKLNLSTLKSGNYIITITANNYNQTTALVVAN